MFILILFFGGYMSFLIFFLYLTISIIIYGIIGVLLYKFYFKKKKNDFLDTNIDDIWNDFYSNYDKKTDPNNERKEEKDNEKVYSSF